MIMFSSTELRIESSKVFNEVQKNSEAEIINRGRPPMVLVLKDHYEHLQERARSNGGE